MGVFNVFKIIPMALNHTINHICKGAVSLRIINTTIFTVIVVHLLDVSTPSSAQVSAKNYISILSLFI